MRSYLKGKFNLFITMNIISPVWSQMETISNSFLCRGLMLIPIAAGVWAINLYISSRRAFARVPRLSICSEARPSDHVGTRGSGISLATSHLSLREVSFSYSCPRSSTSTHGHRDGKPNTMVRTTMVRTTAIRLMLFDHRWYSIQGKQLRHHFFTVFLSNPANQPCDRRSECHQGIVVKFHIPTPAPNKRISLGDNV